MTTLLLRLLRCSNHLCFYCVFNVAQMALLEGDDSRSCRGHDPDDLESRSGEGQGDLVTQQRPLQAADDNESPW